MHSPPNTWVSESSRTFTLFQPGTTYTFTAQAKDRFVNESGGNLSAVSPPFQVTTTPNDGSDVTPAHATIERAGVQLRRSRDAGVVDGIHRRRDAAERDRV